MVITVLYAISISVTNFIYISEDESFEEIKKRAIFIHVDVPGQGDEESDLPNDFHFPTMQNLGEDLVTILDQLRIKYCVGLGDGAGANIIVRFGMMHVSRCLGKSVLPTQNYLKNTICLQCW